MKKAIHTLLLFLLVVPPLFAQKGRFEVRFAVKSVDCAAARADILVQVRSSHRDSTFLLGDANYRFNYDPQKIRNPRLLSQDNFSSAAPANDPNYLPQDLTGSAAGPTRGLVSLNVSFSNTGTGARRVGTEWMTVACLRFELIDTRLVSTNCFGLTWNTNRDFPVTGMNEIVLEGGGKFRSQPVAPSGIFANTQICLSQVCAPPKIDLSLTKRVSNARPAVGEVVSYTLAATNSGAVEATGVEVTDLLPAGLEFQGAAGAGTYTPSTGRWLVGRVAVGSTVSLVIRAKVTAGGPVFNKAEVTRANEPDTDSTPGNANVQEDDFAIVCLTTPLTICPGDEYQLTLPAEYTGIQWFRNGSPIAGATAATLTVTQAGTYSFLLQNGTCPAEGCCPAIFEEGACCKPVICVPVTIKRTRKARL